MGIFSYTDPQTKRVYNFEHGGETPTDEDFAFMRQIIDTDRADYAQKYQRFKGEEFVPDDGTAFGRGWDRGVEDVRGSLGELLQTLGQRTGFEGLADYGSGMEQNAIRNLGEMSLTNPAPMSFRDVEGLGSGLTYLGELAGSSAPVMGGILAGTGIAALTAPEWVPAAVGGALVAAPYYAGSIMQEQERNYGEDNVNLATAFGGGAVAAALDAASLGVLSKLGVGKAAIGAMSGEVGRGLTMRLLTGAGAGAVTEGTTETLQEVTQLLAAGTDPNSPEVQDRLLEAFVGGGVLGGVIGGAGRGAFGKRPEAPTPPPPATPPAGGPTATPPAAPGPTFAFDDEGQGQLFSDLAEGRAPAPATEIPPNLRRPDTSGLPLFDAADTNNRPAATVLNELGVSPNAPIRKRLASMAEGEPQFLEALKKYAATPGLAKDHRDAVKAYISTREGAGISSVPNPIPTEAGAAATAGAVPKAPKAPKAGTKATEGTAPTEARVMQVLQNARKQQVAGKNQLVSKSGAQALVDAGLLTAEDTLLAPTANAKVADLLALGPDEVKARMAATPAAAPEAKPITEEDVKGPEATDLPRVEIKGAEWLKENVNMARDLADRRAITGKIEDLFAQGLTAAQVRNRLQKDGDLNGIPPEEAPGFIVSVRASLGIPSQMAEEGQAEFQDWLKAYQQRKQAKPKAPETALPVTPAAPVVSESAVEAAPEAAPEAEAEIKTTPAIWASKDFDIPVDMLPEPAQTDPKTGEKYQKVRQQDGNIGFVPVSQLRPVPTAPKTQEPNPNAVPGQVTGTAGQVIPTPGIRPTPGKQLASQQATQRESIARQLSVKNQLEAKMADLRSRIGTGNRLPDSLRAEAKKLGVKAAEHKKTLQRELRRLQAQHYSVMSYLNSEAGKAQAEAEGSTNQENIRRRAENDAARVAYRAWYAANTPTEIQAYDADMRGEGLKVAPVVLPETGVATAVDPKARAQALAQEAAAIDALDPTTVEDKAKLLDLIQKGPRRLPGKINENARAAFAYFSKSRDIADALDNIAADAAMPDIPGKRVSSNRETLHPYWKGTGKDAAMKAAQWVEDNLSEETLAYMDEQIGYYMEDTAEAAGDVIDRQIKNTRANEEADEKTLGEYYKAMSAIDNADVSQELGIESGVFSREKLSRMDARTLGSDRELLNEIGIDIDGFLRLKPASIAFGLEAPLHPTVTKALRAGNLRTALEALSATSSDPYISQLAKSLINFIGDTKVYTTRSGGPNTRAEVKRLLTDDAGTVHPGTYVLMSEANLRESQEVSPKYAAAIQNSILLDEATGMNAHAILHEVLHAATARELMFNSNGPVARRLETLRQQVFDAVAKEFTDRGEEIPYGLKDVREFVSEALANQEFQGMLDRLYPTTKKVTALEQLIRTLANFVRTRILRKPAKVYDDNKLVPSRLKQGQESVFDEVDRLVRSIFNTAPEFGIYEPLFDTARRPAAAADAFTNMGMRLRIPNATDAIKLDNAVTQAAKLRGTAQTKAMPTILAYLTPSRNLVDLAKQYFPDADRVHENLTKHSQYVSDLHSTVWNTLKDTYKWLDAHPKLEQAFHSLRTRASKQQIDPRLPEKFYNSFVVRYYTYTPDGTIGEPKYEDFPSASEARDFITKINDAEANGAATTKAKLLFTPDKENAALHRKFKMELDALEAQAPGAKAAYSDYLNIAERLHIEAGAALKDRVAAKFPGRENAYTRNMILRNQYNKIFAERGLLAYQPLQREGDIRISYNGVHPDTNTVEPFVHYVDSMETALRAREALLALPPEYKIRESNTVTVDGVSEVVIDIGPRGRPSPYGQRMAVPSTYVTDVVKTLKAAAIKDADAAGRAALAEGKSQAEADAERARVFKLLNDNADANAERIVEMALDALPESSIFSAYRARTGVSGFTGDLSPLKAAFDAIEQPFDAPDVSRGMFEKFVNSMTRKIGAIHQQADADLVRQALNGQLEALGRQLGNTQISPLEYDKARIYHTALTEALNNPSIPRNDLVTAVNTGAYMFTLFGNVSSVVMNIMGAVTFVYPRLAVRYGPVEAAKMMVRSLRVIANSGRTRMEPRIGPDGKIVYEETDAGAAGRSLRNYKFTAVDHSQGFNKGANKINALGYLADVATKRRMLIDSIVRDDIDSHATQSSTFNKLLHWGSAPLHHVERLVRESAMIANYELELRRMATEKGSDVLTEEEMKKAAMFAVQEAEIMTGTVPATTAPSGAQRGIMPMIMMYKRYPLAMMHMIIRDIARSVPSRAKLVEMYGKDTAEFRNALEDRRIARLQVAAVLGSVALFSGAMGMPLYGLIADLYDAFFREDDEESFDTLVRTGIGELGSKGILNYLFGVEFSSRIGLSDILYRSPLRAEDQPPMWNLIEGFGGPAISILSNWSTRSKALFEQGEYYRALESALPATIRNGMRAARFMSDGGAESMRGDIISDIGPGQALAQALGFSPSAYIRQVELNSEAKRIETAIAAKKTRIMRAINMARRNGDSEAYAEAMAEKEQFDREHPDKRITPEALRQSRRTFARNSEKVRNGIVLSDPQSYDLREIMELSEEPASIWDQ